MADEFKVGEIVQLKSGGPEMTVSNTNLFDKDDHVKCQWFGGRKLDQGAFPTASLVRVRAESNG